MNSNSLAPLLLFCASCAIHAASAPRGCLRGRITLEGPAATAGGVSRIVVRAVRNLAVDGVVQPLSKPQLYRAVCAVTRPAPTDDVHAVTTDSNGTFTFHTLAPGAPYSIFAFDDADGDGAWAPHHSERCGWYAGTGQAGRQWLSPVIAAAANSAAPFLRFAVKRVHAMPLPVPAAGRGRARIVASNGHGSLRHVGPRGQLVLALSGGARERGVAHGQLLAGPIVSFFRFFTLEETTASTRQYEQEVLPFIRRVYALGSGKASGANSGATGARNALTAELVEELRGMIDGMHLAATQARDATLLHVPELGRNVSFDDLVYLNDYGAYPQWGHANDSIAAATATNAAADGRACTQFAFFGADTEGSDVGGGTVVGRNMDGENDVRRLTVSMLLLHAVAPAPRDGAKLHRYVHAFWPGFVGAASGLSERGLHVMMNDGQGHPEHNDEATQLVPGSWTQRDLLARAASLSDMPALIRERAGSRGGTMGSDANLMLAEPSRGNGNGSSVHAMVYEGDRLGGAFRLPGRWPFPPVGIMATNHFKQYGYDPLFPRENFGYEVYFSSLWRYEAGKNMVTALADTGRTFGTAEMVRLLQLTTHATTEHSIVTRPDALELDLAVADARPGGWHAPFLTWTTYKLLELFDTDLQAG